MRTFDNRAIFATILLCISSTMCRKSTPSSPLPTHIKPVQEIVTTIEGCKQKLGNRIRIRGDISTSMLPPKLVLPDGYIELDRLYYSDFDSKRKPKPVTLEGIVNFVEPMPGEVNPEQFGPSVKGVSRVLGQRYMLLTDYIEVIDVDK